MPEARLRISFLLVLSGLFFCALGARAQQTVVRLDPANTKIDFTLGATLHSVHGTFKLKSGEIQVNPQTGQASGSIVADATSGNSDNSSRDQNMHKNILQSDRFPEISFSPALITAIPGHTVEQALESRGTNQLRANGIFRLLGQTHDMTMDLTVENDGNGHLEIATAFAVPYILWGLKSPNTFILRVDNTVNLEIHSQAQVIGPVQ